MKKSSDLIDSQEYLNNTNNLSNPDEILSETMSNLDAEQEEENHDQSVPEKDQSDDDA